MFDQTCSRIILIKCEDNTRNGFNRNKNDLKTKMHDMVSNGKDISMSDWMVSILIILVLIFFFFLKDCSLAYCISSIQHWHFSGHNPKSKKQRGQQCKWKKKKKLKMLPISFQNMKYSWPFLSNTSWAFYNQHHSHSIT